MDMKTKIKEFIERANNLENQADYEQWFSEIDIFTQRYLENHPLRMKISNTIFFKGRANYTEKMLGLLRALEADEDIYYEQRTSEIQQRKSNSMKEHGKLTVLFFASNPKGVVQLGLDEEARMIEESIRKSEYRDKVEFISKWATQTTDILQGINEVNPDIIHFSGHGTDNNEMVLQNSDGSPKIVSKEAISYVISTVSDKVKLVFFNSCFSSGQAEAVTKCIDSAIGMVNPMGDRAACVFATQFYSSLVFGHSLEKAFAQAIGMLMLEGIGEENTPRLYLREGLNASNIMFLK